MTRFVAQPTLSPQRIGVGGDCDFRYAIEGGGKVFHIHYDFVREHTTGIGEGHADSDALAIAGNAVDKSEVYNAEIMARECMAWVWNGVEKSPYGSDRGVGLINAARHASPHLTQFSFKHFAVGVAWQHIDQRHVFRHFVAGQLAFTERDDTV